MARGLLGRNSNLHIRQRRRDALKEADLVILAGKNDYYYIIVYLSERIIAVKFVTLKGGLPSNNSDANENVTEK